MNEPSEQSQNLTQDEAQEHPQPETAPELTILTDPVPEELQTTKDQLLRLTAEFDNFKKRSARERQESFLNTKAAVLTKFLPVLDHFERALGGLPAETREEAFPKGVLMIYELLSGVFAGEGAECFGLPGDAFDPLLHNAVQHREDPDCGENQISDVYARGWRIGEKILREATVAVVN